MGFLGSIPGLGRSPGGGDSSPLQYSCLEESLERGAWWATVHGVTESNMTKRLSTTLRNSVFILRVHLIPRSATYNWYMSNWVMVKIRENDAGKAFNTALILPQGLISAIIIMFNAMLYNNTWSLTVICNCTFFILWGLLLVAFAWEIPWTEEPSRQESISVICPKSWTQLNTHWLLPFVQVAGRSLV